MGGGRDRQINYNCDFKTIFSSQVHGSGPPDIWHIFYSVCLSDSVNQLFIYDGHAQFSC